MARYYIAPKTGGPGGSAAGAPGNSGTFASPWDMQTAFDGGNPGGTVVSGDTLILRKGTYVGIFTQNNDGVTITNYPPDMQNWPQDLPTIDSFFETTLTQSMASTNAQTVATVADASNYHSADELYIYDSTLPYTTLGEHCRVSGAPSGNSVTFIRNLGVTGFKAHAVGEKVGFASGNGGGYVEGGIDVVCKNLRVTSTKPIRALNWERASADGGATFLTTYQDWPYKRAAGFDIGGAGGTNAGLRCQYANLVADNGQEGIGWWEEAADSKLYHTLCINGGVLLSPDRGHGHGFYTQNNSGIKDTYGAISLNSGAHAFKTFGASTAVSNVHVHDGIFCNASIYALSADLVDRVNITTGAGTTCTFTNGSTAVHASSASAFTGTVFTNYKISADGGTKWYTVASVTDGDDLVLTQTFAEATTTPEDVWVHPGWEANGSLVAFFATNNIAPNTGYLMERTAIWSPTNPAGSEPSFGQTTANGIDVVLKDSTVDLGFALGKWSAITFTGNTMVQRGTNINLTSPLLNYQAAGNAVPAGPISIDNNTYYHEDVTRGPFKSPDWAGNPNSGNLTFAQWKANWANAGYTVDANSTDTGGSPSGSKVLVTNNPWERGRFNAAIFNWGGAATVNVTPPNLWLRPGDAYRVYAAESFDQGPTQTGVYNGASIPITMAATTTSAPFGFLDYLGNPIRPASTRPTFGAFIVMRAPG